MKIKFDSGRPIYMQIVEAFKIKIASGEIAGGQKIEPVRELAGEMGVNPNTIQKALSELERIGLMYTERTSGRYVTRDEQVIKGLKREISLGMVSGFMHQMHELGMTNDEIVELIKESGCQNE